MYLCGIYCDVARNMLVFVVFSCKYVVDVHIPPHDTRHMSYRVAHVMHHEMIFRTTQILNNGCLALYLSEFMIFQTCFKFWPVCIIDLFPSLPVEVSVYTFFFGGGRCPSDDSKPNVVAQCKKTLLKALYEFRRLDAKFCN